MYRVTASLVISINDAMFIDTSTDASGSNSIWFGLRNTKSASLNFSKSKCSKDSNLNIFALGKIYSIYVCARNRVGAMSTIIYFCTPIT